MEVRLLLLILVRLLHIVILTKKSIIWVELLRRIMISAEALYSRAAKLPRIEITKPSSVVGKNTVSAMQSGILYGYVGQVEGIVKRMKEEARQEPKVIATGGLAKLISEESNVIDIVDPF